ncbi:MAG: signal recognition particle receptor subunit alpha, partial [Deltaproteobacteria bacterium]|nr:signal recognition particle receptor subunit alpha [Deltaproteobacteria bacterium]
MFESLSEKLNRTFKKLTGRGRLTEANVQDALKEVRLALLEADVNYKVVKKLVSDIRERAVGQDVLEELTSLMGEARTGLEFVGRTPHSLMLVGLQGSGKTTTAAKLARYLRKQGRHPYLVPADIYRPAAVDQLKKLGSEIDVPVHPTDTSQKPDKICLDALSMAGREGADLLIIDTAGRLHIDETMMAELVTIKAKINPAEILLVADAM